MFSGLLAVGLSFKIGSFLITLLALFCYKPPPPKVDTYIMDSTEKDTAETVITNTGSKSTAEPDTGNVNDTLKTENRNCAAEEKLAADGTEESNTNTTAESNGTTQTQDIVPNHKDQHLGNSAFTGDCVSTDF